LHWSKVAKDGDAPSRGVLRRRRLRQLLHSAAEISCCISSAGSASQRLLTSCRRHCRLAVAHRRGLLLATLVCERPLPLGRGGRLGVNRRERRGLPPPLRAGLAWLPKSCGFIMFEPKSYYVQIYCCSLLIIYSQLF
jgi:hypothetical protein